MATVSATSSAAPGKKAARHQGAPLSPIESAREFLQARVQRPALQHPALSDKLKQKIKHSDTWLSRFKRVGDLYAYLRRFDVAKDDPIYLELKQHQLETFEDVRDEFSKRFAVWLDDKTLASDFVVGEQYSAHDVLIFAKTYDLRSGGMFVISAGDAPQLVIIKATLSGGKYANSWLEQGKRLKYYFKSIKGAFGDHFQANAAILNNHHIPVLTFARQSDGEEFVFQGVFSYANHHTENDGAKWFELTKVDQPADVLIDETHLRQELEGQVEDSLKASPETRRKRLAATSKKPAQVSVVTKAFIRNPDVVAEVLLRAGGVCECCNKVGPFISKAQGTPFLEVHHKVRLADGGDDSVENAVALCPNCHREKHYG